MKCYNTVKQLNKRLIVNVKNHKLSDGQEAEVCGSRRATDLQSHKAIKLYGSKANKLIRKDLKVFKLILIGTRVKGG